MRWLHQATQFVFPNNNLVNVPKIKSNPGYTDKSDGKSNTICRIIGICIEWYQQKYIGMHCDMNVYLIKYLCWENC